MPELPEVEILVRHLGPLIQGRTIQRVRVHRNRVLADTPVRRLQRVLSGSKFTALTRRGKFLLFELQPKSGRQPIHLIGHLGMTGRMYLLPNDAKLPKHAAVTLDFGEDRFVFEDTRYFGKFTLNQESIEQLGPEPLGNDFSVEFLNTALSHSRQPIKVKLLDQSVVAGLGNIYAGEALFVAGIAPTIPSSDLTATQVSRLVLAIREVLQKAVELGTRAALDYAGAGSKGGLFYYGRDPASPQIIEEPFQVYDRAGQPCRVCGQSIERLVQAARSTYHCPNCQRSK
jgi:formamidopyrimidine-DNA glycosylase